MHRLLFLLVPALALGACASEATTTLPTAREAPASSVTAAPSPCAPAIDRTDVPYADDGDPLQALDLYLPDDVDCGPVPLVVWVHGGGWRIGDKTSSITDKVALWNDAGWAVASVNYRLSDASVPEADRVMAPSHDEDVAAAMGWLVDHAEEIGVDPAHVALLGHSAGAGIVAALAVDPAYLEAVGVQPADLACVAPLDTEAFSIETAVGTSGELADIYTSAFGTDPERWAELSPLSHVGDAPLPPLFLVTRGLPARREIVAQFADAVERAGGDVTIADAPTFTHEDVNKQIGAPGDDVLTPPLQAWLTGCLTG